MTGLLLLLAGGLAGAAWWRLLKSRETARAAAAQACQDHGLLLIDDTVVLDAVQIRRVRGLPHRYGLRYRFEFANSAGQLHRGGTVLVAPRRSAMVVIDTRDGRVIEEFHAG